MTTSTRKQVAVLRARHDAEWRDPAAVVGQWHDAGTVDERLVRHRVHGAWWETLAEQDVTLLVTREYEHLVLALRAAPDRPAVTHIRIPHPSGLVADVARGVVHLASTRNPNQVYDFMPVTAVADGDGARPLENRPLVPVRARFFPGGLYLHDLALIGGRLHANAVAQNAVVQLDESGGYRRVWWPRCVETQAGPLFDRNYLQLNSIAAGNDLATSYFSASTDAISARRPGHQNFPVDGRGVVFSGATREPVVRGLTRPHSARLSDGQLWVADSGYGAVGVVDGGRFRAAVRLPGWTRGLCIRGKIAFVGTSRVLPRFRQYAPGLDPASAVCGIHAIEIQSGRVLGSLTWPFGNQIFGVEAVPSRFAAGFPFSARTNGSGRRERSLFYAFRTALTQENA